MLQKILGQVLTLAPSLALVTALAAIFLASLFLGLKELIILVGVAPACRERIVIPHLITPVIIILISSL
jgi:hypothetical protein